VRRRAAAQALAAVPDAAPQLVAALETERAQASRVMEGLMANLLVDPQRDVRILAVGILDTLRHERVEDWLLQLIEVDDDPNVCGAALDVLTQVGGEAAYGPVERLLARFEGEPFIGFAGKLLLDRLGQESIQGSTHA
jgi:hypothetical protein